jgi:hypothetical protein
MAGEKAERISTIAERGDRDLAPTLERGKMARNDQEKVNDISRPQMEAHLHLR